SRHAGPFRVLDSSAWQSSPSISHLSASLLCVGRMGCGHLPGRQQPTYNDQAFPVLHWIGEEEIDLMKIKLVLALPAYALVGIWAAYSLGGQGDKHRPGEHFAPKVLIIFTKDPRAGAMITDARVRQLGSRMFLVGKLVRQGGADSAWDK